MAQNQIFRGMARSIRKQGDITYYRYHSTDVVITLQDKSIQLDSGGFRTATTKTAMNQASNQYGLGFGVFQKAGKWFVEWQGNTLPFEDRMILRNIDFSQDEEDQS